MSLTSLCSVWADCLFLLFPQWSSFVKSSFWEAAALKSPQVQLLPLCPGALWQTWPTCGGGEDCVCGLRWAWKGVWALSEHFIWQCHQFTTLLKSLLFLSGEFWIPTTHKSKAAEKLQIITAAECISDIQYFSWNQVLDLIFPIPSKAKHIEQLTATCLHKLYPQWADDVGLKKNI